MPVPGFSADYVDQQEEARIFLRLKRFFIIP